MKKQTIEIKLPLEYSISELKKAIKKQAGSNIGEINIIRKSLDARKKTKLLWNIKVEINSERRDFQAIEQNILNLPYKKRETHVVVVGSGPAGIFSGLVLLKAGFKVTLLEKGADVDTRGIDIDNLVKSGKFNSDSNFAFGEGGAGTFSDGKLTSRSKHINIEKDFILASYINNGAPEEIYSMVHPHVGSDNLKIIVKNMRNKFIELGGKILFSTSFLSFNKRADKIISTETTKGTIDCNYLIMATGHSSFDTYKELVKSGLGFTTKNFAIGFRAEHRQDLINKAQWGSTSVEGLKAAEYRLTAKTETASVFSFCMCPGGTIVPAAAVENTSVVNGMSNYQRSGEFANAAVVAGFNFSTAYNREVPPLEALEKLKQLEESYYSSTGGYRVPGMKISEFINDKSPTKIKDTSYSLGITPFNLKELLPPSIIEPLQKGLINFSKKIDGYEDGSIMGLESKTSAPIQVNRERSGLCDGFSNLYFLGEGSGWAGGIISSGADGIKGALDIISKES